jgi:hypothetical protein
VVGVAQWRWRRTPGASDIRPGSQAVALQVNGEPCVERPTTTSTIYAGSFKFGQLTLGPLVDDGGGDLRWELGVPCDLVVGDIVIIGDMG